MENKEASDVPSGDVYQGYAVPRFLRLIYVIFIVWACYYLVNWMAPDLKIWMAKP
jgi:hypothetical protein